MDLNKEIEIAKNARKNAYAPYSSYLVGAALKCSSGEIYSGCNIENNGIMSICAERVAFLKAISEGEKNFEYIVLCGGPSLNSIDKCLPCGYCRQFMKEFVNSSFKIFSVDNHNEITKYTIDELLPHSFKL